MLQFFRKKKNPNLLPVKLLKRLRKEADNKYIYFKVPGLPPPYRSYEILEWSNAVEDYLVYEHTSSAENCEKIIKDLKKYYIQREICCMKRFLRV